MMSNLRYWATLLCCLTGTMPVMATETPSLGTGKDAPAPTHHEMSLEEMSKKLDNPLSDLWMLWMQNDHMIFNGDISSKNRAVNVSYFEPVISIPVSDQWNLINRPVITRINAQLPDLDLGRLEDNLGGLPRGLGLGNPGSGGIVDKLLNNANWDNEAAWGDLVYLAMLSPQTYPNFGNGKLLWGAGITTMWPTASDNKFGTQKYSAGPAALAMYEGPKWKVGMLAQQWWSYAGNDNRADVSRLDAQYFWFYQLPHLWQIGAAPSITADWKANSDNRWTVPLGVGINKTFRIGPLPIRISMEVHKTVVQPDSFGQDWNFRLVFIPIIPNMVKVWQGTEKLP